MMSIKTDSEVKEGAQEVAREIGVPLSTIINAYLKEFIQRREVRLVAPPKMTPHLERVIAIAEKDLKTKRNISRALSSPEDVRAYFQSK